MTIEYNIELSEKEESTKATSKKEAILKKMELFFLPQGQSTLFTPIDIELLCVEYLECCGYIINKTEKDIQVYSTSYLVNIFYDSVIKKGYLPIKDPKRDLHIASFMVDYISETQQLTQEASIKLCALIIYVTVNYESYFELRNKVREFTLFTPANLTWLLRKVYDIIDNSSLYTKDNSANFEKIWSSFEEDYIKNNGEDYLSFDL